MPFNPEQHANLGYVDKPYKELLDRIRKAHKRSVKDELEYLIEQAAKDTQLSPAITISKK